MAIQRINPDDIEVVPLTTPVELEANVLGGLVVSVKTSMSSGLIL
jgi:hypothetical protein